jgi:hypothetical protein
MLYLFEPVHNLIPQLGTCFSRDPFLLSLFGILNYLDIPGFNFASISQSVKSELFLRGSPRNGR